MLFLKTIAKEFELELNFRTETDGKRVIGRYVDLLERIGQWRGREVEFGKDLIGIRRNEKTDNLYTALIGLGPEKEDGTRLEVFVEDKEALQRWGRPDPITGELQHLIDVYEPQSSDDSMSITKLEQYTRTELNKRIGEVVEYESTIADLENVPGMENKKIRFGDTIKIKDTKFNPPLYLEARVHTQDRSIVDKSKKQVTLGDYIEYTEEEIRSIWKELQAEIRRKLARLISVTVLSSAGDVFKNGEGETELTVKTFLSGEEVDQDASIYNYYWTKRDKRGVPVSGWSASGKSVSVAASDIDEKVTYQVEVSQDGTTMTIGRITISNVFDGEDGEPGPEGVQGPPGKDGQTLYTWVKYADTPTSGMSDSPDGKKYIGLAYNKTTPTKSTKYADYEWAKIEGDKGVPGEPGKDGQPRFTWVKYADDDKGNGMSDSPEDKRYLGLAYNKTAATESSNPADYTWSPLYDNVKPGGRNLWPFTDYETVDIKEVLDNYWYTKNAGTPEITTVNLVGSPFDGRKTLRYWSKVDGSSKEYVLNPQENGNHYLTLKPNTEYVFSAWVYHGTGIDNIYFVPWEYDSDGSGRTSMGGTFVSQKSNEQLPKMRNTLQNR
ncbi:phage tail spike protein [Virgibacillus halophilus]|uniref:Phage tail spike protein n=1 Tax=Tigheibacillus halophilus TaxID=361280 RepID=A0ABU5C9B0_9BACI|nr:phage tail spike protein [Virgibacillus halophilus]